MTKENLTAIELEYIDNIENNELKIKQDIIRKCNDAKKLLNENGYLVKHILHITDLKDYIHSGEHHTKKLETIKAYIERDFNIEDSYNVGAIYDAIDTFNRTKGE